MQIKLFYENICCLEYSLKTNRAMYVITYKFAMSVLYHWASNKVTFSELIWAFIKQDCGVSNKSSRPKPSELVSLIHQSFDKVTAGLAQRCFHHVEKLEKQLYRAFLNINTMLDNKKVLFKIHSSLHSIPCIERHESWKCLISASSCCFKPLLHYNINQI